MKELFSKGVTVIFVTHDTNAIKSLCNRTLYINKGEFVCYGPSEEVVDLYSKVTREEMIEHSKRNDGTPISPVKKYLILIPQIKLLKKMRNLIRELLIFDKAQGCYTHRN